MSFSAIWLLANVALTTFTSHVIYGLREKANVGRYLIEKKIGEGGMGEVYLAKHTTLRRPTALKLLPPERAGEMTIERFEREVRETSRLSHPNTVAIYDYGRTRDGIFYYAMEYLDGLDLQRLVERDGPMPAERVVRIVSQIASALAEAHGAGLVHRDMKPANVMLCTRGGMSDTVKVLDFGLVKDLARGDVKQTAVNALVGTPHYLAPEAIANPKLVDGRTDLYAVGAIAYFLLVGEEPFPGESIATVCAAHLHRAPARPSLRVNMPAALEAVILSCLAKDPNERPQTAAELEKALRLCVLEAA